MSAAFRQFSHRESEDEIIPVPGEQETLQENNLPEHKFKSTTASTDHNNPGSMEYSDGVNPAPPYQQAMDEREPEANDYESLGEGHPAYDYIEAVSHTLTLRNRAWAKCKKTMLFLVPIFASQIVNFLAGLLYTSFLFVDKTDLGTTFYENGAMVAKEQRIFRVSFALAAASCAPLLVRFSARKIAQWGSVLLIFSCILLSLTTTGDVMTILFSITAGFAGGLFRTTGVVSTVDHLNTRPALALIISYISFLIGKVIIASGSFYIYQVKAVWRMTSYDPVVSLVHRDWPLRVFEITGVIGLLAGIFLQKNSQAQHNVTRLVKHPPIYFLILITVLASMGLSILTNASNLTPIFGSLLVLFVLLIIPGKESLNKKSALLSMGISVLAVGLVTMVQSRFAQVVALIFLLGAATVLYQVLMPLVLMNTTGRSNIKLALPVLVCFGEVGGLIGMSIMEKQSHRGALYFAGVSLIIAGVGAIIVCVLIKRWPPLSDDNFSRAIAICAETTGEEEEAENVVVECVEDRVEEEEEADDPGDEEAEEPGEEEAEVPVEDLREEESENSGLTGVAPVDC
ncbi:uncharacterized protein [Haliotis cracherodii]|uniref:uncharacterized protein n=1 Tax=Haliotis cracherodii TaxID=6455 RepID=UPI0039E8474C